MDTVRRWSELSAKTRDVLVVAVQFAFCCAIYATSIYRLTPARADVPVAAHIGVVAVLCACSLLRRRAPVLAISLATVPFAVDLALGATLPVWLIASDLVYAVALYGSDRQSLWIVRLSAAGSVLLCGVVYLVTRDSREVVVTLGAAAAFLGTALWWARSVRQHKKAARDERDRAEALTVIAKLDRRAAVEAERSRMARDLHDVVAGHLSAIAIQSEAALRLVDSSGSPPHGFGSSSGPSVRDIVASMRTNSTDALAEMRSMIGLLRHGAGTDETAAPGRVDELFRLVDSARASGTEVRVSGDFADDSAPTHVLPAAVDQAAYRIVQESLTNAVVHAPGASTGVDLRCNGGELTVAVVNEVSSTACAARSEGHTGTGLDNMRQRAELLGGKFHAGIDGTKWTVTAVLPLTTTATS